MEEIVQDNVRIIVPDGKPRVVETYNVDRFHELLNRVANNMELKAIDLVDDSTRILRKIYHLRNKLMLAYAEKIVLTNGNDVVLSAMNESDQAMSVPIVIDIAEVNRQIRKSQRSQCLIC